MRVSNVVNGNSWVSSAQQPQAIASVRVYPGANGTFTLFQDDGKTYAYEKGGGTITQLTWDDTAHQLRQKGAPAWSGPDENVVTVVGEAAGSASK